MRGIILGFKPLSYHFLTNIWVVKYSVKINGKIKEREKYVVGMQQAHNDGEINMQAALAVAGLYGGKRIRILSTRFVDSGVSKL